MAKYKKYHGNILFKGFSVDVEFFAKTHKEACEIVNNARGIGNMTTSYISKYFSFYPMDKTFDGIIGYVMGTGGYRTLQAYMSKKMPLVDLMEVLVAVKNEETPE